MLASSALALTGCQSGGKIAVFQPGDGSASVKLPTVCEGFLVPVKVPKVDRHTDAGTAYSKTADALDSANTRLSIGGDCVRDERADYAKESAK